MTHGQPIPASIDISQSAPALQLSTDQSIVDATPKGTGKTREVAPNTGAPAATMPIPAVVESLNGTPKQTEINVLMVDDRPENLIALEAILSDIGRPDEKLNLIRAESGVVALRRLLEAEFALILLDVQMPGMDGYETASLIRQRERTQHTPIIFLTAINTSDLNVARGYSLGAVDYISKPFSADVLRSKVAVFVDLYRKTLEIKQMAEAAQRQAELLRLSNDELGKTNKLMGGLYRELERKTDELEAERDFIDTIIESVGSYIVLFDRDASLIRYNKACQELTGVPFGELRGRKAWDIAIVDDDKEKTKEAIGRLQDGEESVQVDLRLRTKDGDVRLVSMTFTALSDDLGIPITIIASGIDVTERWNAEEKIRRINEELEERVRQRTSQLQQSNEDLEREVSERRKAEAALKLAKNQAEEANSAKDRFLAVLSLELRTPLTPVLAIVQMLHEEPEMNDDARAWLDTIQRNIQLEARLIDDLLDLTRISNGKVQVSKRKINLHEVIADAVATCQEDVRRKNLSLVLNLAAKKTTIEGDPARLQQVFWNLIKNAVKFTPEGGQISIETKLNGEEIECVVSDTGIGIPAESLSRVFEPFDQGDETITKQFGGLGLGLAISRALVEQHGGHVAARSEGRGQGASFHVSIPVIEQDNVPRETPRSKKKHKLQSAATILLVEDNADTNNVLRLLLERKGYSVYSASSVQGALAIAHEHACDVIISDISLPDGTGHEMIKQLAKRGPVRGIAMSGYGMEDDIRRSLDAGFRAHLVKPLDFEKLNGALQSLLASEQPTAAAARFLCF
jgi:PAS domain S-box-containing protein